MQGRPVHPLLEEAGERSPESMAAPSVEKPGEVTFTPETIAIALAQHARRLYDLKRYADAADLARRATELTPRDASLWNACGAYLRSARRLTEAVWCYRRCLELAPHHASAWSNVGNALSELKRVDTAIACHAAAVRLAPQEGRFHYNHGVALMLANRHAEAIASIERALAITPDVPQFRWDLARARLHAGDYAQGWIDYETRFLTGDLPDRKPPGERWRGEPYPGRRLLIVSEQGYGDTIWAARYFERVKALGGTLVVECRRELIPLIRMMPCIDEVVEKSDPLPAADLYCYVCSIPGLFAHDEDPIPQLPYLGPPQDRRRQFARVMAPANGQTRVGIVWSGSTTFKANHDRATTLANFLNAFALAGVQLYSLQKGPPEAELHGLPKGAPIIDLAPLLRDFADTAAAIAELDLVIMTDSAVGHLSGALGKPTWMLLGFVPHWLWQSERTNSPWYPSMRLFRPRAWGDWHSVFDAAATALMTLPGHRESAVPGAKSGLSNFPVSSSSIE